MNYDDDYTSSAAQAERIASDLMRRLGASLLDAVDLLSADRERTCASQTGTGKRYLEIVRKRWVPHLKTVHSFAVRELTSMLMAPQLDEEKRRLNTRLTNCVRQISELQAQVEAYNLQISANSAKLVAADTQPWLIDAEQLVQAEKETLNVSSMARLATARAISFADSCIPRVPGEEPPTDPIEAAVRAAFSAPTESDDLKQYELPDEVAALRSFSPS